MTKILVSSEFGRLLVNAYNVSGGGAMRLGTRTVKFGLTLAIGRRHYRRNSIGKRDERHRPYARQGYEQLLSQSPGFYRSHSVCNTGLITYW